MEGGGCGGRITLAVFVSIKEQMLVLVLQFIIIKSYDIKDDLLSSVS